jgi:hypothetical protein
MGAMSFLNSIIDVVVVAMGVTLNSKLQHSELSSPCALFKTRVCRVAEGDVTRCRLSIGVYACKLCDKPRAFTPSCHVCYVNTPDIDTRNHVKKAKEQELVSKVCYSKTWGIMSEQLLLHRALPPFLMDNRKEPSSIP